MQSSEQLERMANPVCEVLLTEKELELPAESIEPAAGAVVDFRGVVRTLEDEREISGIDYEAHRPMAQHQLSRIASQAAEKFALDHVIIHHRLGFVPTGRPSLWLRVAARHRAEAFTAGEWIVDELKRKVPIWKHPKFKLQVDSCERAAEVEKL
jgi:molybdopterin synthase catalytic subunit